MHMADALLSPAVGAAGWLAAAGLLGLASRQVAREPDSSKVPAMGVLGAFVFSAQMVNFAIPGTGSSGHIGGGLLLAVLLGPWAGFLVMASVLAVQALLFADGGLLAWGCNVVNLGLWPCLVVPPYVYRPLVPRVGTAVAAVVAAVAGLQAGALGVVVETSLSGIADLPFVGFAALVLPIHVPIGLVEGLATASLLAFVARAEPGLLRGQEATRPAGRRLLALVGALAVATGGALCWFASSRPDGLEWAVAEVAGTEDVAAPAAPAHALSGRVQRATSALPGYTVGGEAEGDGSWPRVDAAASLSGLLGGAVTLVLVGAIGLALRPSRRAAARHG